MQVAAQNSLKSEQQHGRKQTPEWLCAQSAISLNDRHHSCTLGFVFNVLSKRPQQYVYLTLSLDPRAGHFHPNWRRAQAQHLDWRSPAIYETRYAGEGSGGRVARCSCPLTLPEGFTPRCTGRASMISKLGVDGCCKCEARRGVCARVLAFTALALRGTAARPRPIQLFFFHLIPPNHITY
jgi:hypothetical protein